MSLLTSIIGVTGHVYSPSAWEPKAGVHMFEALTGLKQNKTKLAATNTFFKGSKDKRNRRKGILSKANR